VLLEWILCDNYIRGEERVVELKLILSEIEKMGTKSEILDLKKAIDELKKEKDEDHDDEDMRSHSTQSVIDQQIRAHRKQSMILIEGNAVEGLWHL